MISSWTAKEKILVAAVLAAVSNFIILPVLAPRFAAGGAAAVSSTNLKVRIRSGGLRIASSESRFVVFQNRGGWGGSITNSLEIGDFRGVNVQWSADMCVEKLVVSGEVVESQNLYLESVDVKSLEESAVERRIVKEETFDNKPINLAKGAGGRFMLQPNIFFNSRREIVEDDYRGLFVYTVS